MTSGIFKQTALLLIALLFAGISFSQERGARQQKKEKIEQLKIAFFSTELDLPEEEAIVFWPIYNDMQTAIRQEKRIQKKNTYELKNNSITLSDTEIKTKTNAIFDSQTKEVEIKKFHINKIAGVIGYKKAVKLLSLEQRFKRELLNKLNEGRKPQGNTPSKGTQR
ncbi:MAG: hypothetical protein MK105_10940 [Crocinitomicaceae bacterium]|nr:hypothetical protein [Crocinitomicaceae bacterium]